MRALCAIEVTGYCTVHARHLKSVCRASRTRSRHRVEPERLFASSVEIVYAPPKPSRELVRYAACRGKSPKPVSRDIRAGLMWTKREEIHGLWIVFSPRHVLVI